MKIIYMIFLVEVIMKIQGKGKSAMGNCVIVVGPVSCCIPSAFLGWCPFHDKHENDQNHYYVSNWCFK